jgi:hypothetical protein
VKSADFLSSTKLILRLCACNKIEKSNKEDKELVDIAPGWG